MVRRSEEERGFQALLEEIEAKVDVFGEQVISNGKRIDQEASDFDRRIAALDEKVGTYTRKLLSKLDERFEVVTRDLNAMASRLNAHEQSHLS